MGFLVVFLHCQSCIGGFCCTSNLTLGIFFSSKSFILLQLGGLNALLAVEKSPALPVVSKAPTLILGMDVSHGSPGQSDIPSIAAVHDD